MAVVTRLIVMSRMVKRSRAFQRAQNAPWKHGRELKAEKQGEGGVKGNGLLGCLTSTLMAMGWQDRWACGLFNVNTDGNGLANRLACGLFNVARMAKGSGRLGCLTSQGRQRTMGCWAV